MSSTVKEMNSLIDIDNPLACHEAYADPFGDGHSYNPEDICTDCKNKNKDCDCLPF